MRLHEPLRYCEFRVLAADGQVDDCPHFSVGTVAGMHFCVTHAPLVAKAVSDEGVEFVKNLVWIAPPPIAQSVEL